MRPCLLSGLRLSPVALPSRWRRRPRSRRPRSIVRSELSGLRRMRPALPSGSRPFSTQTSHSKTRWLAYGVAAITRPTCRAACSSATTGPSMASSTTTRSSCPKTTIRRIRIRCAFTCTAASRARGRLRSIAYGSTRCRAAPKRSRCFRTGGCGRCGGRRRRSTTSSRILDRLKRTYNIDENRVYLTGISDGGTGVYFMAFKDPTPWASFLPMIGNMVVLGTPSVRAEGEMYPGNAVNRPIYVVNTGRDRLYPAHVVQLYVDHLRKLGRSSRLPCLPGPGPFDGVVAERAPGARVVRARSSPRAAARQDFVADGARRSVQSRALARHRSAWSGRRREPPARQQPAAPRTRARLRPADQLDRPIAAVARMKSSAGSNAFRIGLRAGDRIRRGERQTRGDGTRHRPGNGQVGSGRSRAARRRTRRRSHDARRRLRAGRGRAAAVADLSAAQAVGPRRSRAARKCGGGVDRRRESIYAAAVAVDLRLPPSVLGRRERAHGVRGPGRAEHGDDAEVGRARQRSDDGLRGGAEHRTRQVNETGEQSRGPKA